MLTREQYWARWKSPGYASLVALKAEWVNSDGCSCVPDFFLPGCQEHDWNYRTHREILTGQPITKEESDLRLKWYIQLKSWFGRYSPMAWWRWRAVMRFGAKAWEDGAKEAA